MKKSESLKNTEWLHVRVSPELRHTIEKKIAESGLSVSEFMRRAAARATVVVRPVLSAEERRLLENLEACRSDIGNFANALKALSYDDRLRMFRNVSFMLDWFKMVAPLTLAVNEFINEVKKKKQ